MDMLENQKVVMKDKHILLASKYLKHAKIVIYFFSASWAENTRDLVDKLKVLYEENRKRNTKMEIIYVSADSEEMHFQKDFSRQGPWAAIPFKNNTADILRWRYDITCLPQIVVCKKRRWIDHIKER
ncbi:unnamed protein product [Acanthoscelides obtectus]|uniref:Thioredoxin-like fold domain-containing protein n=1 Tax=Acanthoscelides obtectus TaxID=200917 RepID=A0A9P0PZV8_ACAOB|nr:unnamed protein product [Acanthoscelides obtectus]CAK1656485.1 Nucleoredoxin-like protein 2 [Acanthoscelides obtectus]